MQFYNFFKKEQIDLCTYVSYYSSKFYSPESREFKFNTAASNDKYRTQDCKLLDAPVDTKLFPV